MAIPAQSTSESSFEFDQGRLLAMQIMLCSRMDDLFGELGVTSYRTNRMYVGPCPVHGGDNPGALNIYFGGESVPGYWRCLSRHCEGTFKKTIIGFVRGVLSNRQYGWSGPNSKRTVTFTQTIDYCCKFLGVKFAQLKVDEVELEKRRYTQHIQSVVKTIEQRKATTTRQHCVSKLNIPAEYFIGRGWSPSILERYDVGTPKSESSPMHGRVVVPIYEDTGRFLLGATSRSIYEQCEKCKMWHNHKDDCPNSKDWFDFCKWKNSPGFQRETCLYNYWNARGHIRRTGTAALVESPGDLWRLEEAGINIGLSMLGSSLSDQQQIILEMSGAMNIISLMNTDPAGKEATKKLKEQLGRAFRVISPEIPANDLGCLPPADVRRILSPVIDKLCM